MWGFQDAQSSALTAFVQTQNRLTGCTMQQHRQCIETSRYILREVDRLETTINSLPVISKNQKSLQ